MKGRNRKIIYHLLFFFCVSFLVACKSDPVNLRSLAPAETLVYLETKDLGAALGALTQSKAFKDNAENTKDFSAVSGVQVAIAVTGFETSEKQLTEQNSVLNFKPLFVALVDTKSWEWQTRTFTEEMLGNFVNDAYGGEVELEVTSKDGGEFYEWTAQDGRKAFAFVQKSIVIFSNNSELVEKCLAIKRGQAESLMKSEDLRRAYDSNAENKFAFGYVSADGIAQIANFAGVSAAIEATEEDGGRSFIARVLPQVLRNSTKEIIWTSNKSDGGVEDNYLITLDPKFSGVFKESLAPSPPANMNFGEFLPAEIRTATKYNLKNPSIAWRSLLLVTKETTDAVSGGLLQQFAVGMLASYGISDPELFLSSVDSEIITAQFDADGEKAVTIAFSKNIKDLKTSLSEIINFKSEPENVENAEVWYSKDKLISAAFLGNFLIVGNAEGVLKCLQAKQNGPNLSKNSSFVKFWESKSSAATFGAGLDSDEKILSVLGTPKEGVKSSGTSFLVQTDFTAKGITRRTTSDFGLIGMILEQIDE